MLWEKISKFNLGLKKGQVELRDHDPKWAEAFEMFSSEFEKAIPLDICEIFHIGSTSVPGISAKPVLDVLGVAPSLEIFDAKREKLEILGFTWKGEFGISGRRYLPLYDSDGKKAFVHLHVFERGALEIISHLGFRDRLRANPTLASEYHELKTKLATEFGDSRESYTESKSAFIKKISSGDYGQGGA